MAIQFYCLGCGQAIEVDDEYANRPIACPFCHTTVTAPATSQLNQPPPARQSEPAAAAPGPGEGVVRPAPAAASPPGSSGAWICTLAFVCGLGIVAALGAYLLVLSQNPEITEAFASRPSQAEMQKIVMDAAQRNPGMVGKLAAIVISIAVMDIVGLTAGIIGVIRARSRRWQAIVGLVICSAVSMCFCVSIIAQLRMRL